MFAARDLRPMLAVLADNEPPLADPALVYEPKYDGIRALVLVEPDAAGPRVAIWSRNGNDKAPQFPELVEALAAWAPTMPGTLVLDGEIVALDPDGRPAGFQRLQGRIHIKVPGYTSRVRQRTPEEQPTAFFVFDMLREGNDDLRARPLTERRARLTGLFDEHPPPSPLLRLTRQTSGDGRALLDEARAQGWEGLIVKHARSPYRAGRRSPEWRKLKLLQQDEFVVGGWTAPRGSRARFGALMLGVFDDSSLRYVGDVGTGFTHDEIERVWTLLSARESSVSPFSPVPKTTVVPHWVEPTLVVQIRYAEVTDEGRLRHPAYLGIRDDKAPAAVRAPRARAPRRKAVRTLRVDNPLVSSASDAAMLVQQLTDLESRRKNGRVRLPDGDTLDVTNLHKAFWPDPGLTKGDLLRYYSRIAPLILPVVNDRPLVMKRLPNGVTGESFYQHRAPEPVPGGVRIEPLPDDDVPARLVGGGLKTLLYMAQLASISMDPWFSRVDALDHADQVAIDLDPQPGATFAQVLDVARWVHDELVRLDVPAWPKTSGAEGVHIFIPLPAGTPYQAGMLFCQIVATLVAGRYPQVATVERTVNRRKPGTIYVDYLQNIQGKTLACAYSARASAFAGVSAPLTWDEVHTDVRPEQFTIETMIDRVKDVGDLWEGLRTASGVDLLSALDRVGSRDSKIRKPAKGPKARS